MVHMVGDIVKIEKFKSSKKNKCSLAQSIASHTHGYLCFTSFACDGLRFTRMAIASYLSAVVDVVSAGFGACRNDRDRVNRWRFAGVPM